MSKIIKGASSAPGKITFKLYEVGAEKITKIITVATIGDVWAELDKILPIEDIKLETTTGEVYRIILDGELIGQMFAMPDKTKLNGF